jgi:hypothetical protein
VTTKITLDKAIIKAALEWKLENYLPDLLVDEVLVTDCRGRIDLDFDNTGPEVASESQSIVRGHISFKARNQHETFRRMNQRKVNDLFTLSVKQDEGEDIAGYESGSSAVSMGHCRASPYYPPCGMDCWLRHTPEPQESKRVGAPSAGHIPSSIPPYTYHRLPPDFMRIMMLQPGSGEDPVVCNLKQQKIPHAILGLAQPSDVIFEALSYTWGNPTPTHVITCNGSAFPVCVNLFHALVHLRLEDRIRPLWIDAICINQDDIAEKNEQIRHMYTIYQSATRVVVWLGLHYEDSDLAMYGVKYLKHQNNRHALTRHDHHPECIQNLEMLILSLESLFQRPWFTRSWIRQEIAAAKQVMVRCGSDEVSWTSLKKALNCHWRLVEKLFANAPSSSYTYHLKSEPSPGEAISLRYLKRTPLVGESLLSRGGDLRSLWYYHAGGLLEHLMVSRAFDATDARDKVYCVLGMANVPMESGSAMQDVHTSHYIPKMRVDYAATVSEVYQFVAKYIVNRDKNLDILCILSTHRDTNSTDLPSWTPDWRVPTSTIPLFSNWEYFSYKFGAAGFTKTIRQDQCDLGRLVVSGFEICSVTELMPFGVSFIQHPPEEPAGQVEDFDPGQHLRRVALTEKGSGCVPSSAMVGDRVWILFGCKMPIVLRIMKNDRELICQVVGPCHLTNFMWGKALKEFEAGTYESQRVVLV